MTWLNLLTIALLTVNILGALICLSCAIREGRNGKKVILYWIASGVFIFSIIFCAKLI